MGYQRKTIDEFQIQTNYGYGWDVECCEFTRREALQRLREYRENTNAQIKIVKKRIKKS